MQDNKDIAISLFSEILTVEQLLRSRLAKALPKGMELSHFSVLNHLSHINDERTPAQLAKSFHVTRGAMTNTLRKLEVSGYIHIRPDWDDARRKLVAISPAGRSARDTAIGAVAPVIKDVVGEMGVETLKSTLPVLRDLRLRLE
ncbi:MAG: MarR family winged helix-turn-helix transcriptional regulator [Paracoccaceae bacterium]